MHGLAAIYIGISVAYGKQMTGGRINSLPIVLQAENVRWKKLYGMEYAREEGKGWYHHFLAYVIGAGILGLIILTIGYSEQTENLVRPLMVWTLAVAIDFVVSFSYTIFPKRAND